ncbi:MAG: ABC transporter permease subunit, partial [Alphaproteobacteria bacterium]|nr:ABC transporter permease subunit [Alphaproteobacteria bacterium]
MRSISIIAKRELKSYFATPLAYIFIVIFLALTGAFAFYIGRFFTREQASLITFFNYHPWLYLMLVPAVSMRLWAEERKTGTIEILMTLPVSTLDAVLGKFFAAWAFLGIALLGTFPIWISVNVLGDPDNGVIVASYLGSFFMAGAFLAI